MSCIVIGIAEVCVTEMSVTQILERQSKLRKSRRVAVRHVTSRWHRGFVPGDFTQSNQVGFSGWVLKRFLHLWGKSTQVHLSFSDEEMRFSSFFQVWYFVFFAFQIRHTTAQFYRSFSDFKCNGCIAMLVSTSAGRFQGCIYHQLHGTVGHSILTTAHE